jgi:hypothetical protein
MKTDDLRDWVSYFAGNTTISSKSTDDPIEVSSSSFTGTVKVRIGPPQQGKTRYARLSPAQARQLACALLYAAERAQESSEFDRENSN